MPNESKVPVGGAAGAVMGWVRRASGRFGVGQAERTLRLIETLPLGGRKQLLLVECAGQRFLVGTGGDVVSTIVAVPNGAEAAQ